VPKEFYRPRTPDQRTARERFEQLNRFVTERHGWITSITSPPGVRVILIDALHSSKLPSDLEALGYRVIEAGEGERLIAGTIVERLTRTSSGALELMTEGSTKPVVTITHAGIVPVLRFEVIAPTN
jgi:hypothetical protein